MTGKETKMFLENHPDLLRLLEIEEYQTLVKLVPNEHLANVLFVLHELRLTTDVSYTLWKGDSEMNTSWARYDKLISWGLTHVGKSAHWYITNDLTGEIVYINET